MHHDLDILHGDLHPFRRMARSVVEMAFITGVIVRVLHAVFAHSTELTWFSFVGRFILIPVVALGAASIHLSNYPVRQWLWRAPVFAIIEAATSAVASAALIATGRERWGTGPAEMADWPWIAGEIMLWHIVIICAFSALLGLIVQLVRRREFAVEGRHQQLQAYVHAHPHDAPKAAAAAVPVATATGTSADPSAPSSGDGAPPSA